MTNDETRQLIEKVTRAEERYTQSVLAARALEERGDPRAATNFYHEAAARADTLSLLTNANLATSDRWADIAGGIRVAARRLERGE